LGYEDATRPSRITAMNTVRFALVLVAVFLASVVRAQVPQLINFQGRVAVAGMNFDGTGQFKFALVNGAGTTTFWSNDGTSSAGSEPTTAVSLAVTKGLYSVLLGDASLTNMSAIPSGVFNNSDVRLRVWFNDGVNGSQQLSPDQRLAAVAYAVMAGNVPDGSIISTKIATGAVGSAQLANGAVGANQLASGAAAANLNASGQSGVASGGLVLSATENAALVNAGYVKIATIDGGGGWEQRINRPSPSARYSHSAVWTGSEMIVWGGISGAGVMNDGGRYSPATNSWTLTSTAGAPAPRLAHSAVWTGNEMIVWGGGPNGGYFNDGARYFPASNSWSVVTNTGAPSAREFHTAVWTGNEMIVWGGLGGGGVPAVALNNGARYNPSTNSWTAISSAGAPTPRYSHTAVWTGNEMIVFGGYPGGVGSNGLNDGARYNPSTNSWTALPTLGAPASRFQQTAVWTGSEMIVWGGHSGGFGGTPGPLNTGARYNPTTNVWTAVTTANAPVARSEHSAIWTGTEMMIWGGLGATPLNDGSRYNPAADTWVPVTSAAAPAARYAHRGVWTGSEMIVWGDATPAAAPSTTADVLIPPRTLGRAFHSRVCRRPPRAVITPRSGLAAK
jgi:N-acetylneuraminic acid mutarotase